MALCDAALSGVYDCEVDYQQPSIFCCCCQEGSCCNTGRRPASLLAEIRRRHRCNPLGAYFRKASRLEAASVEAFRLLGRELRAHGAPEQLRLCARRAAREELRHTRLTAALAVHFGAEPVVPTYGPTPAIRPLEAVALENAVEGCARETYGAIVALWQAEHAGDSQVAGVMREIAQDEVRHAELSWAIAEWAAPRLTGEARSRVAERRQAAFEELESETAAGVPSQLVAIAGLPPAATAQRLARGVRAAVLGA
jgi:hypothetical protein